MATGALLANPDLLGIGVSGDGDTASIGVGQFVHLVRRNMPLVYVVEQNRDAQLTALLRDEIPAYAARFVSVLQYDGLPLDATTVVDGVLSHRGRTGGAR